MTFEDVQRGFFFKEDLKKSFKLGMVISYLRAVQKKIEDNTLETRKNVKRASFEKKKESILNINLDKEKVRDTKQRRDLASYNEI